MSKDREKKTIWQKFLRWWPLFVVPALIIGAVLFFCLESNRNYGQLATSLITISGVVLTLWITQERAIEQQEREDDRHHARLEAEAKMHDERLIADAKMQDERLRIESEREHERLIAGAQKDRVQRSITQRIDLAEKLAAAIEHLYDESELKQAAGVQEILFQIDDWHALIGTEISAIKGEAEGTEVKKVKLQQESLRHRQELFDIAYKFDTKNVELLKSRARGLKQRLVGNDDHSLAELDFSGMVISRSSLVKNNDSQIDLAGVFAKDFIMSNSEMYFVDLSYAHLEGADLLCAHLEEANLQCAHLEKANLQCAHLEGADLLYAHLEEANLQCAHLEKANLQCAHLEKATVSTYMREAHLEKANLQCAHLEEANLQCAHLEEANLQCAHLEGANLSCVHLEGADLSNAHLEGVVLRSAHLEGADLLCVHLEGADLLCAHLEGAVLRSAHLEGADLEGVYFDWNALRDKNLLDKSCYDGQTVFPKGFNPEQYGMILVDKKGAS